MAKQTAGYLGGFSGKLGPAVGYMWNGKWCLRAHNPMVHNPRTEAQTEHREVFKQEVQLAARMRQAVVKSMTGLAREAGMTSYNLFVKVNQPAFGVEDGRLTVDYSALRLSMGDVPQVELKEMAWSDDNVLSVSFRPGAGRNHDYVYLYLYAPGCEQGFLAAPVYRYQKHISLMMPGYFAGYELQAYLMTMSEDGRWGESLYAGVVEQGAECLTSGRSSERSGEALFAAGGSGETAHEVVLGGVGDADVDEVAGVGPAGGPGGGD
jgi:hypothetical protein